jgi:HTH-type transcriptional regulator/antitoxin HigA
MEEGMTTHVARVFPPGEILKEELEAREWSQTDLAEILGRPVKLVNEIIAAKRAISPETAQGLADAFGTSAELWMNLEAQYQLHRAKRGDDAVARRAELFKAAPIKEMQRRGWIAETKDIDALEASVCEFFGVSTLDQVKTLSHAAKKSTSYEEDATPAQRAWVQRVRALGESVQAGLFSEQRVIDGQHRLHALLQARADIRLVPNVLAECGVRLLIVEPLTGTKVDGVCVWLDPSRPVIALSMRFDRIDSFWFALAHELGHVMHRDGMTNPVVDLDLVGDSAVKSEDKPDTERLADQFAANFLIPSQELAGFVARVRPLYSKERIKGFAARLKIHPGIVVGQLAFRKEIGYSHSREMLDKVRDIVIEATLTDGWNQSLG